MIQTEFSKSLGENLKALRKNRDLSVAELALKIGISEDDVRKYERGERAMTVEKMITFSVALDCSPQNIIEGLDPRSGEKSPITKEIRMLSPIEHKIIRRMATDWTGDRKALILACGIYMAIPPERRREIIMHLDLQKDQSLQAGEISEADLPDGLDYMYQALGNLYEM